MNIQEELKKLREAKEEISTKLKNYEAKKQSDLAEAAKQINEKYADLIKPEAEKLDNHNKKITNFYHSLSAFSNFNASDIGHILANLISIFEGINYVYQEEEYSKKDVVQYILDSDEIERKVYLKIIVAEEDKPTYYTEEIINSLVEQGKAIVLSDSQTRNKRLSFYKAAMTTESLKQCVDFTNFAYAKEFIDEVISHRIGDTISDIPRIEADIKDISYQELERMSQEFIGSKKEQILAHYQEVEAKREKQMKEKLALENVMRRENLEKVLRKQPQAVSK